jgi:hypothetical protein
MATPTSASAEMAKQAVEAELARFNALAVDVPADLVERVRAYLRAKPDRDMGRRGASGHRRGAVRNEAVRLARFTLVNGLGAVC